MKKLLRPDLLDALASDVRVEGRLLPCGILRRLILRQATSKYSPLTVDQALLLAGVYHALARNLLSDLSDGLHPEPRRAVWDRTWESRPQLIQAHRLLFKPMELADGVRLPLKTHQFLSTLPTDLLVDLATWAPPVVGLPRDPEGPAWVLGNLFPAFLAGRGIPDKSIRVRVLAQATKGRFSVLDAAHFALPLLEPIYQDHRDRIAALSPSLEVAQALTGVGRAMAARLRQQAVGVHQHE